MLNNEQNIRVWNIINSKSVNLCRVLREQMFDYCKVDNKTQRDLIMMDMVRRVECNVYSIMLLSKSSLQENGSIYLKLPVGLLLRTCMSDCLMGLYVSLLLQEELVQFVQSLNEDYVRSLLPRVDVYKDKISELGFTEEFIESMYMLKLEDNFCKYLSFNETANEYTNIAMWNVKKGKAITIKRIVEVLRNNQYTAEVSRRLYAYYKYFSQYEHFSESGYGDTLADFNKDNVSFEKAFECLISGMYLLLENIKTSPEILSNS